MYASMSPKSTSELIYLYVSWIPGGNSLAKEKEESRRIEVSNQYNSD